MNETYHAPNHHGRWYRPYCFVVLVYCCRLLCCFTCVRVFMCGYGRIFTVYQTQLYQLVHRLITDNITCLMQKGSVYDTNTGTVRRCCSGHWWWLHWASTVVYRQETMVNLAISIGQEEKTDQAVKGWLDHKSPSIEILNHSQARALREGNTRERNWWTMVEYLVLSKSIDNHPNQTDNSDRFYQPNCSTHI